MNFYETKHTNKKKISIKAYSFFGKIYIIKIVYFTNETIFIINIQIHIYVYIFNLRIISFSFQTLINYIHVTQTKDCVKTTKRWNETKASSGNNCKARGKASKNF